MGPIAETPAAGPAALHKSTNPRPPSAIFAAPPCRDSPHRPQNRKIGRFQPIFAIFALKRPKNVFQIPFLDLTGPFFSPRTRRAPRSRRMAKTSWRTWRSLQEKFFGSNARSCRVAAPAQGRKSTLHPAFIFCQCPPPFGASATHAPPSHSECPFGSPRTLQVVFMRETTVNALHIFSISVIKTTATR